MSTEATSGESSTKNLSGSIVPPAVQPSPNPPPITGVDPAVPGSKPTNRSTTRKDSQPKTGDAPTEHTTPRQGSVPLSSADAESDSKGPQYPPRLPQRRPTAEQEPTDDPLSEYPPLPPDAAVGLYFAEHSDVMEPFEHPGLGFPRSDADALAFGQEDDDEEYFSNSDDAESGDDGPGPEDKDDQPADEGFTMVEHKRRGNRGGGQARGRRGQHPHHRHPQPSGHRVLTKGRGADSHGSRNQRGLEGRSREGGEGGVPGSYHDDDPRRHGGSGSSSASAAAAGSTVLGALGGIASKFQANFMPTPEQQIKALKDEVKTLRSEKKQITNWAHEKHSELKQAVSYIHHLQDGMHHVEQEKIRMREAISGLENEASVLRRELADAKNLANIRGKELLGSQVFLTKADTLSVSEVSDKVNNLNEEIFQAAALLGENLIPQQYTEEQRKAAMASVAEHLGPNVIAMLNAEARKEVPEVNPLLVQVVLQVFLVSFCARLIQKWCPEEPEKSRTLESIYDSIRATEEQAVFGRWRALTRSRITINPDIWLAELLKALDKLVEVAGWKIASEADRKGFGQKVKPIFKAVEDLRSALGEKVTSADFEVFLLVGGTAFNAGYMEDAYGDAKASPPSRGAPVELVAGTTGLGLKRMMKERTSTGHVQYANVVSAKIALESTLREALEPPPLKKSSKKGKSGSSKASDAAAKAKAAPAPSVTTAPTPTPTASAAKSSPPNTARASPPPPPPGLSGNGKTSSSSSSPTSLPSSTPAPAPTSSVPAPTSDKHTDSSNPGTPPSTADEGGQEDPAKPVDRPETDAAGGDDGVAAPAKTSAPGNN